MITCTRDLEAIMDQFIIFDRYRIVEHRSTVEEGVPVFTIEVPAKWAHNAERIILPRIPACDRNHIEVRGLPWWRCLLPGESKQVVRPSFHFQSWLGTLSHR